METNDPAERLQHIYRIATRLIENAPPPGPGTSSEDAEALALDVKMLRTIVLVARVQLASPSPASQRKTLERIEDLVRRWGSVSAGTWMMKVAQGDDLLFLKPASPRKQ